MRLNSQRPAGTLWQQAPSMVTAAPSSTPCAQPSAPAPAEPVRAPGSEPVAGSGGGRADRELTPLPDAHETVNRVMLHERAAAGAHATEDGSQHLHQCRTSAHRPCQQSVDP